MSYDVFIERTVLKSIKKFPSHDIQRIKEVLKKLRTFPEGLDTNRLSQIQPPPFHRIPISITWTYIFSSFSSLSFSFVS